MNKEKFQKIIQVPGGWKNRENFCKWFEEKNTGKKGVCEKRQRIYEFSKKFSEDYSLRYTPDRDSRRSAWEEKQGLYLAEQAGINYNEHRKFELWDIDFYKTRG